MKKAIVALKKPRGQTSKYVSYKQMMSVDERISRLKKLHHFILKDEASIYAALAADLGKPSTEAYAGEIAPTLDEIELATKNLKKWARPRRVSSAWWKLGHFMAKSAIHPVPLGRVLIIAPWNYPFQLALIPLIGAIAGGNQVVLKPSEFAPSTSRLLQKLVSEVFATNEVRVVEGDHLVSQKLCTEEWGMIFFTGGTETGKKIMAAAAQTLSPVTLELGGKSPCILDDTVDLETSLKRILWGKCFNAGQTCVAPDYLLVPTQLQKSVVEVSNQILKSFYPRSAENSLDYSKIIHKNHFDRLVSLTSGGRVVVGGETDHHNLKLAPTLIVDVDLKSKLMTEEIFGPLLPIIPYEEMNDAFKIIADRPNPLALYLFSNNKRLQERVIQEVPCGGICINDVLVHLSNPQLPFGGIRTSGIGAYHGFKSFEIFSHWKSVERKKLIGDIQLRYPPYTTKLTKFLKRFV